MLRVVLLLAALGLGLLAPARAQTGSCNLLESRQLDRDPYTGIIQIQGPFLVRCEGGAELRAEQGTLNEFTRELVLIGSVYFQDPEQTLTADNASYSSLIGRLYATGNVVFTNRAEGSTIRGPELEYFRPMEGRPEALVNAGQRPHLTLKPKARPESSEPLELDADRVSIAGQADLSAYGNVVIKRTDLDATAAEAQYNADTEGLELRGGANIRNEEFALDGEVIQARLAQGALEHVHARTDAALQGKELTVTAPDLQMFFTEDLLQRAVARGATDGRAVAVARNFRLEADSIDALTPGQQLDQVIAIGKARGAAMDTTRVDSTLAAPAPEGVAAATADSVPADSVPADTAARADSTASSAQDLIAQDWIVGDTLIGFFARADSAARAQDPAADTAAVLRRVVARGAAQSLYRVEPRDSVAIRSGRRAVNYLAGETIELTFLEGEVELAEVTGLRRGLYLDPTVGNSTTPPTAAPAAGGAISPTPRREGADGG